MKCEICKKGIEETFLKKIVGTYIKDSKGKGHVVCSLCQKNFENNKWNLLKELKSS